MTTENKHSEKEANKIQKEVERIKTEETKAIIIEKKKKKEYIQVIKNIDKRPY